MVLLMEFKIWVVEYLDSLLDDSKLFLFSNEHEARAKYEELYNELEEFIYDYSDDSSELYKRTVASLWISSELTDISDLMVRISSR